MNWPPRLCSSDRLQLHIYSYLNRVWSSGRLGAETHRKVELVWRLRQLGPDFETIADLRSGNRNALRSIFRQFVLLRRQLERLGRELLAVDGTRLKAVNYRGGNFTRASPTEFIRR